jgi:hypothetical protein
MQANRQAYGIEPAVAAAHLFIVGAAGILGFYDGLVDSHDAKTSKKQLFLR